MSTPVVHEPETLPRWLQERCCRCRAHTPMWTDLPDRTPGEQVALCETCAPVTAPADVPTKAAWCAAERKLERRPAWAT